ncbi:hypothetical protein QR680_004807 [Steinernema hermaphroditum]|uniref:ATP synthase subunit s, mitochondrial n=1 Tax=Steinernema hermaphroditum TaxID=289476 RepID=A0AA39HPW2_9BILA|nr:hypothetical protein QR680_004807 [Steinernema hermaphroditum]
MLRRCMPHLCGVIDQRRHFNALPFKVYSIRRRIAEFTANKYAPERVATMGPDLACLEWLMECGSPKVTMSDGAEITTISEMRKYIEGAGFDVRRLPSSQALASEPKKGESEIIYTSRWKHVPDVHIVEVDACDSAIANPGFPYFGQCRRIEKLKMNFCDYFGDEGIRELALGRPAKTLKDLEIVINPCISDASLYWLIQMKALRRLHMYFLPYVANRAAVLRQLRISLPKCKVTFPEVENIGYGYEEAKKAKSSFELFVGSCSSDRILRILLTSPHVSCVHFKVPSVVVLLNVPQISVDSGTSFPHFSLHVTLIEIMGNSRSRQL